jgi:IclR family acetate operon transcriptional repressor
MSSVKRSLKLIELIVGANSPPTHAELARLLSIPKSTLSQLLSALREAGYVAEIDGRYHAGIQLMSLGYRIARKDRALMSLKPALDGLAHQAGETVLLAVRVRDQFMYIEQSPGPHPIRYAVNIGDTRPLETTAIGRVFLAFQDPAPPQINAALARRLAEIRRSGYSVNEGEVMTDVHAIAAPIFNASHRQPIAVVAVLGPRTRMADMKKRIWPQLRRAAKQIEEATAA